MKCSNAYLLFTLTLTFALAACPALAGPKRNFSLKSSLGSSNSSNSSASRSLSKTWVKPTQSNVLQLNNGASSLNQVTSRKLNVKKLGHTNVNVPATNFSNSLKRTKIGQFDPSKFTPVVPGNAGQIGVGRGGSLGPILDANKSTGKFSDKLKPIFDRGQVGVFDPGKIVDTGKPPILDPGIGNGTGGGIFDPGNIFDPKKPPIFDPGNIFDPKDPPVLDPDNGGGNNPPADPGNGNNPPADPGNGNNNPPDCPPHCPPYGGNCGFPWVFPVPYPVGGGCYNGGGYYGGGTTVVETYAPVTTVAATSVPAAGQSLQPMDLEVLEVRQLDRGDAARQMGAAYRIWLREKSGAAVTTPFNVGLIAAIGRVPATDSAFVMQRVEKLDAGQTLTVDIRLPAKAYSMARNADGQPVPFGFLTAVVDTHSEVQQADRQNDVTTLSRTDIAMVAQQ